MKLFVIGRVLEPERRRTPKGKVLVEFGLLVGRQAEQFSVWEDDDELFVVASQLKEGHRIVLIVNPAVDNRGRLKYYVNRIAPAPSGLSESLMSLFDSGDMSAAEEEKAEAHGPEGKRPQKVGV